MFFDLSRPPHQNAGVQDKIVGAAVLEASC